VAVRAGAAVTVEELEALCAERLAKYKRPVAIEVLDELPKNAIGKIDKPALRHLAQRRRV
jgi:long-chain acyl-CoA synthetase